MIRVVLDTNVFISAALKLISRPRSVIRWVDEAGQLLKSSATEAELNRVLQRPYLSDKITDEFNSTVQRIMARAALIEVTRPITICRDPKDDKFLERAVNGRADVIVSGDADLLVLGRIEDIPIVNPATFARDFI